MATRQAAKFINDNDMDVFKLWRIWILHWPQSARKLKGAVEGRTALTTTSIFCFFNSAPFGFPKGQAPYSRFSMR